MKKIDLYYNWMKKGKLDGGSGLCHALEHNGYGYKKFSKIFKPVHDEWYLETDIWYWGSDTELSEKKGEFTELRQTIFLLWCAMNGEL